MDRLLTERVLVDCRQRPVDCQQPVKQAVTPMMQMLQLAVARGLTAAASLTRDLLSHRRQLLTDCHPLNRHEIVSNDYFSFKFKTATTNSLFQSEPGISNTLLFTSDTGFLTAGYPFSQPVFSARSLMGT